MGIALFAVGELVAPLHQLLGQFGRTLLGRNTPPRIRPLSVQALTSRECAARAVPLASGHSRPPRPLRVVRVAEPLRAPASAGRMVISGRMADVCAELDRLTALEAAGRPPSTRAQVAAPSR